MHSRNVKTRKIPNADTHCPIQTQCPERESTAVSVKRIVHTNEADCALSYFKFHLNIELACWLTSYGYATVRQLPHAWKL